MKRVLTFLAIMLLPLSVMAMTPISDSTLSDVTGQAGVDITNDLTMDVTINTVAWGDEDGIGTGTTAGWVGITGLNLVGLTIKGTQSIDVYTVGDVTKVRMTTGTETAPIAIGITNALSLNVMLGATDATITEYAAPNLTQQLGVLSLGALKFNLFGTTDIYADGDCGVVQDVDVTIRNFEIGYLSWGDTDGADTGYTGAGYVGIADLKIGGDIKIDGIVSINVGTSTTDGTAVVQEFGSGADNFAITMGAITGKVTLDDSASFTGATAADVLGDIYIQGLGVTIMAGSSTIIGAH